MPKKHDTQQIRDIVGSLDFQHVGVKEIARRLKAQEVGLPYPVDISPRQVSNYRQKYREIHGMPPDLEPNGTERVETIDAVLNRAVALMGREVTAFEAKRRGSMTRERVAVLDRMHTTLRKWQRAQGTATGKLKTSQVTPSGRPTNEPEHESAVERLARQEREAKAEPGHAAAELTPQTRAWKGLREPLGRDLRAALRGVEVEEDSRRSRQ
jgi:hypothetical protein